MIQGFFKAKKPIAAICIAPAVVARVLGEFKVKLTIGNDPGTAQAVEACGAIHQNCASHDFIVDSENLIFTTPAYMYDDAAIKDVYLGIQGCLQAMLNH